MNGMTITEQLALISQQAQAEYQAVLMWVCLSALAGLGVFFGLLLLGKACKAYVDRLRRHGRIGGILLGAMTVYMILYAGTKPPSHLWRFEYANGVSDNGSYCTNDQIRAAWTYNLAAIEYTIRAAYQDLTITNANGQCTDPLHQLPDAMVRDSSHVWNVANATNMRVVVYAQYVPPPAVTTNGVLHLNGVMQTMDDVPGKFVTPGVRIHVNLETGESFIITPTNEPPAVSTLQSINPNQEEAQE